MKKLLNSKYNLIVLSLLLVPVFAEAATIGTIATSVTESLKEFVTLINTLAIVAGIGFATAAAFKFKQHKDNPTQVPLGQPLGLLGIGVMLVWLNFILLSSGSTLGASEGAGNKQYKAGDKPGWLQN